MGNSPDRPSDRPFEAADQSFFSGIKEETHFYIVRHGRSEGNAKKVFQGRLDMALDEAGRGRPRHHPGRLIAARAGLGNREHPGGRLPRT
jgi:hypothetical protein